MVIVHYTFAVITVLVTHSVTLKVRAAGELVQVSRVLLRQRHVETSCRCLTSAYDLNRVDLVKVRASQMPVLAVCNHVDILHDE